MHFFETLVRDVAQQRTTLFKSGINEMSGFKVNYLNVMVIGSQVLEILPNQRPL
jgi:hypothetical protein